MLASKIICDDTYSNKSLQEIRVHDFTSPGPYPTVVLPDRTSTFHALFEPQYQQLDSFIHRPRHPSFEGCPRYPQSSDHIPIFAPDPSNSIPSFTARVTLPSRDAPVIPSPPITSPSSPPIPAARFPHSPPASPFLRRMPPLSPVLRSHTHLRPRSQQLVSLIHRLHHPSFEGCPRYPQSSDHKPILAPDTPRPLIQPRPLLRRRFLLKHLPMRMGLDSSRSPWQNRAPWVLRLSPMVTEPFQRLRNPRTVTPVVLRRPLTLKNQRPLTINLLTRRRKSVGFDWQMRCE